VNRDQTEQMKRNIGLSGADYGHSNVGGRGLKGRTSKGKRIKQARRNQSSVTRHRGPMLNHQSSKQS